jgi:uncharacterized metal-binding protein YceD (DUF177 family)
MRAYTRHCEERSDEAIQNGDAALDCFASLAMTIQCPRCSSAIEIDGR